MKKKIIINDQETDYSVTDDGKIFNDKTNRELKGTFSTNEYHSIQLVINGKPKTFMVHRLVAEAFCENPNNYNIVAHIDRNKKNDRASNLRWIDSQGNALKRNKAIRKQNQKYNGDFTESNWKPIFGHNDFMINENGMVVNINTKNILIPQDRNGYQRVNLLNSRCSLHILVWETFNNQKIPSGMQVDHIDGNKQNNSLSNLRLVNSSENMKNAYANNHKGAVAVKQYSLDGEYIKSYPTIREAANTVQAQEAGLKDATNRYGTCTNYYWLRENDPITIQEVLNNWIPEGYRKIKSLPTYCINKEGFVYNKRTKKLTPIKYRTDGKPFILIKGQRVNIENLLKETFDLP